MGDTLRVVTNKVTEPLIIRCAPWEHGGHGVVVNRVKVLPTVPGLRATYDVDAEGCEVRLMVNGYPDPCSVEHTTRWYSSKTGMVHTIELVATGNGTVRSSMLTVAEEE